MPQIDTISKPVESVPSRLGPSTLRASEGWPFARSITNVVDRLAPPRPAPSKALRQLACVLPQLAQMCELAPWRQLARSANWQCTHPCRRQLVFVTCRPLPRYALG
jgi:hypothetical protein